MTFQAVLLIGFVFIVTERIKARITMPPWLVPLVAAAIGVGSVFLLAESDWAHEQVVFGIPLDAVNNYSKVVAGVVLGLGGAGIADKGINTIANIGENQPKPPTD